MGGPGLLGVALGLPRRERHDDIDRRRNCHDALEALVGWRLGRPSRWASLPLGRRSLVPSQHRVDTVTPVQGIEVEAAEQLGGPPLRRQRKHQVLGRQRPVTPPTGLLLGCSQQFSQVWA